MTTGLHDPPKFTVSPLSGGETVLLCALAADQALVALQQQGGTVAYGRIQRVEDDDGRLVVTILAPHHRYEERVASDEFDEVVYL